jgi:hypothetical protein
MCSIRNLPEGRETNSRVSIGDVEVEGEDSKQRGIAHQAKYQKPSLKKAPKFKNFNYTQSTYTVRSSLRTITGTAGAIVYNLAAA